jgi:uncharacterized integral membrane protein
VSDRRFFLDWLWIVTLGEAAGFLLPAAVGVATVSWGSVSFPLLMLAGFVEGAVLGMSQWWVLRRRISELSPVRWILYTAFAAGAAYGIGLAPSTFAAVWQHWPLPVQILVGATLAGALLVSIGAAQWLELRRRVRRAGRWIAVTAAAWCFALAAFLGIATPLWHEGQSVGAAVAVGAVAGLAMALVMAAITGAAMTRLSHQTRMPRGAA